MDEDPWYPGAPTQQAPRFSKRFDDVAPPGTEGYYDVPPPGVDHLERPGLTKDHVASKDKEGDRMHDRVDRERRNERESIDKSREKDDWERRDREDRRIRERREDERRDFDKERYKDDRDRHRNDDKLRNRNDRGRDRDYDYEKDGGGHRHDRYDRHSVDRKRSKRSSSPYVSKYRGDIKDTTPERPRKKEKDYEEKSDDRKKEKKIKEKKKKKDSDEKEKKKKKKKEKKALIQKEAAAAVAAAAAAAVVSSTTLPIIKVKEEPQSSDEALSSEIPLKPLKTSTALIQLTDVVVKSEPPDDSKHLKSDETKLSSVEMSMNPEPPETKVVEVSLKAVPSVEPDSQAVDSKPELKVTESLYAGLVDDTEITTTSVVATCKGNGAREDGELDEDKAAIMSMSISPKKEEFLAPLPELSKWERDESAEKLDDSSETTEKESPELEDSKSAKVVTTEVLKRAENAIFQKAINAIRPIEIKKISESRKVLYQNPEPKVIEPEIDREARKSVNVTLNVGKNERNVEILSEPLKKTKIERPKFKGVQLSPTRLSVKERLGEKIEDEAKLASIKCVVDQRRESSKGDTTPRSRSPRVTNKDRRVSVSLETRIDNVSLMPNSERKVFVEDRKRERIERPRIEARQAEEPMRMHERTDLRKVDRITRTPPPPPLVAYKLRKEEEDDKDERKKDRKSRDDRKRKKEHRSRSKSRERKKRKDKKHKKERERGLDRRQKHSKEKELPQDKSPDEDKEVGDAPVSLETWKKQRRNPRLVSDRKRSVLDEASFEPDYSATDSESEDDDRSTLIATKRAKIEDSSISAESEAKTSKKRPKPSSSEDEDSSSTESSSTDSDSSVESHRKKKKKHKKRKKRKASRKDSSSDSDAYTDSSDSSSEEEKHRKKKKSKSKSKQSKKKKKSKHK